MTPENSQQDQSLLNGKRILVVEDEFYIADDLNRLLTRAGAKVVGPVGSVPKAEEAIASNEFDCAVIDLNLHGESGLPIAERLHLLNIPFVIATGYGCLAVPAHLQDVTRVEKPFEPDAMLDIVTRLSCGDAR